MSPFCLPPIGFENVDGDPQAVVDKLSDLQAHLAPELRVTFEDLLLTEQHFRALGFDVEHEKIPFRALIDNADVRDKWRQEHGYGAGINMFLPYWKAALKLVALNAGCPEDNIPGRGVYYTVHRHNGEGWRQQDILEPRALFFDDDDCNVDLAALHAKLPFTSLVRTKNGHHAYWTIRPGSLPIDHLELYQTAISEVLGTDPSVKDAARILRVPSFLHQKEDPFKIGLLHLDVGHTVSPDDIASVLGLDLTARTLIDFGKRSASKGKGSGKIQSLADIKLTDEMQADVHRVSAFVEQLVELPGSGVMGRHAQTYKAGCLAGDLGVLPTEALPLVLEWNEKNNDPPLPDSEIEHQVTSSYKYRRDPFACKYFGDLTSLYQNLLADSTVDEEVGVKDIDPDHPFFEGVEVVQIPSDVEAVEWMLEHHPLQADEYRFLDLPQGGGKTEFAKRTTDQYGTAIILGHRVALTQNIGQRFGVANYQKDKAAEKVASTIHSLSRLEFDQARMDLFGYERDIFIVDEYDKVLDTVGSKGQVKKPLKTRQELFDRMALSRCGLFMSADNPADYVEYIARMMHLRKFKQGKQASVTYFYQRKARALNIRRVASNRGLAEFYGACRRHKTGDKALVMFATSKKSPHEIREAVLKVRPDLHVLSITSENSDQPEIQELLAEPNRMVTEYNVVICSPTCGVGINITEPVKHVYVTHTLRKVLVDDVAQMMGRCRNIESGSVTYGFYNFKEKFESYDDATLEDMANTYAERTDKGIESYVQRDILTGRTRLVDDEYLDLWKIKQKREIISYNNPQQEILKVFKRHGWRYTNYVVELDAEEDGPLFGLWQKCRSDMDDAKEERWTDHCCGVALAEDISHDDAKKLENEYVKSVEDKLQLKRSQLGMFFGQPVTRDLVDRDRDGEYRKECRQFARAVILSSETMDYGDKNTKKPSGAEVIATLEHEATNNKHATQYTHQMMQTMLFLEFCKVVLPNAFNSVDNDGFFLKSGKKVKEKIFAFAKNYAGPLKRLFRTSLSEEDRAMSFCNAMMRRLGAKVGRHQITTEEGRVWAYRYDFSQVREDSKAEMIRIKNKYEHILSEAEFTNMLTGMHDQATAA